MSNYLRKLGVFHTPPPLCALEDTTLTEYVININGLKPTTLLGNNAFYKGRLCNKMNTNSSAQFSTVQILTKIQKPAF